MSQGPVTRPLLVTADADVLEDLLRLAATAGVEVTVVPDAHAARAAWAGAPFVVVGVDAAAGCTRLRLPRRAGVAVLGQDLDDGGIWQTAVALGAEHVLFLPDAESWLTARLADAAEGGGNEADVVAVIGGRGGAGATTLACALAVTAARQGRRVLLLDADPYGGGLDLVFGAEHADGVRWAELARTRGRLSGTALRASLPDLGQARLSAVSFERHDRREVDPEALASVLSAARRSSELVVVDLPRNVGACERLVLTEARSALLVVPCEVRAAAAAACVATAVAPHCRDLQLVVRGPGPGGLSAHDVVRALGLPLAGELRPEPGLERDLERGQAPASRGRGPLAGLCGALLEAWPWARVRGDAA